MLPETVSVALAEIGDHGVDAGGAACAHGRLGGHPRARDPRKAQIAQSLYHDKTNSIADICRTLRISRATLYRYLTTGTEEPT